MQRVSDPILAAAAIRFANLGTPVFPCGPDAKQPLTPKLLPRRAIVGRLVHDWWQRAPDANIGLPTGASTGILVVDIDVHPGGSRFAASEQVRSEGPVDNWAGCPQAAKQPGPHGAVPSLSRARRPS
jgi:hypothetical protein